MTDVGNLKLEGSFSRDLNNANEYVSRVQSAIRAIGPASARSQAEWQLARELYSRFRWNKERFFKKHVRSIYEDVTSGFTKHLRVSDLLYAVAEKYPTLLPSRSMIDQERSLKRQSLKEGHEADQGLFIAHVLANNECGLHLIHAMLRPKPEAIERLAEFKRTGTMDLGLAHVRREGRVGHLTHTNPAYINAESDAVTAALETGVDLILMDDRIEAGVLRGGVVEHKKYKGRRIFNAGLNLTHLYYGQLSLIDFIVVRELGLLNKMYRGHWVSESYDEQFEDYVEKPWIAAVDTFAIGGGLQLLCVMDRVIAERGSFFNIPASKEGFIPGLANMLLPSIVGPRLTRDGLFYEKKFHADTPDGRLICDQVVSSEEMDSAIAANVDQMLKAGFVSYTSNRKALRAAANPLSVYQKYQATYARQQSFCLFDQKTAMNVEQNWVAPQGKLLPTGS